MWSLDDDQFSPKRDCWNNYVDFADLKYGVKSIYSFKR